MKSMFESIKYENLKVNQRGKSKGMKLALLVIFALTIVITPAFAELDLSNEKIVSSNDRLILQFAENTVRYGFSQTYVTHHIEYGIVDMGITEVLLDDARVNVLGDSFTIKNDNISLYAKSLGDGKFSINAYIFTDSGIYKESFNAKIIPPERTVITSPGIIEEPEITDEGARILEEYWALRSDDTIEPVEEPESITVEEQYIPELIMTTSHDLRTYWKETFNIDVRTYDSNINNNPDIYPFEGKLDGVDISVTLSLDNEQFATLNGITQYGQWEGEYFIKENISTPGEYVVDVIASYLGKIVSNTSAMFVIGTTTGGGSNNNAPIANAGSDQSLVEGDGDWKLGNTVNLSGSGSDPDGDDFTLLWTFTSKPDGDANPTTLLDVTTTKPSFVPDRIGIYVIQLTVTDSKGRTGTDTVTITVT